MCECVSYFDMYKRKCIDEIYFNIWPYQSMYDFVSERQTHVIETAWQANNRQQRVKPNWLDWYKDVWENLINLSIALVLRWYSIAVVVDVFDTLCFTYAQFPSIFIYWVEVVICVCLLAAGLVWLFGSLSVLCFNRLTQFTEIIMFTAVFRYTYMYCQCICVWYIYAISNWFICNHIHLVVCWNNALVVSVQFVACFPSSDFPLNSHRCK